MPGFVLEKEIMMSLKNDLLDELSYEKDELEKAEKLASKYPNVVLICSKSSNSFNQFMQQQKNPNRENISKDPASTSFGGLLSAAMLARKSKY